MAVVAGLAIAGATLGSIAPTPAGAAGCEGGLSAPALNSLLRGARVGPGGIAGMDYAHAHPLPDGRVLWLFQDAFFGDVLHLDDAAFVHNAGLIQFGSCVRALFSGKTQTPKSWIGASSENRLTHWFWPLDGTMGNDGLFHQFMVEMTNVNGTGAAVGATPTRVWIASIRLSDLAVVRFVPAPDDKDEPLYGFSIASDAEWTYLYGHCYRQYTNPGYAGAHDLECGPEMYLARVPRGEVFTTPEYWDGAGWAPDRGSAASVMHRGVAANPMQVRNFDGTFVAVTKIDDWFGLTVYIDTASSPAGPWTEVASFSPDVVCGDCTTYFAHLLPWRDGNGNLLVSISNNAWSHSTVNNTPQLYRPRLMSVRAPDGVSAGDPPPDCKITTTLRSGSSGSQVRCLRRRLAQLGFAVITTKTTFDKTVKAAVMAFQEQHGLSPDGVVGSNTGKALGIRGVRTVTAGPLPGPTVCPVTVTLKYGNTGQQVSCLNNRLKQLGFTIQGSLSTFGLTTKNAVTWFQATHGLNADGVVGPATRKALGF